MLYRIHRLMCFVFLCLMSGIVMSQPRDSYAFLIEEGQVSVTPAVCPQQLCETQTVAMSGQFIGFLPAGATQLFFTDSSIVTQPNIDFQLPENPNENSNGTIRDIEFSFENNRLVVFGTINSLAFDGPFIEYQFSASVMDGMGSMDGMDNGVKESFYSVVPDLRKCVSPLCGGYFVKSVNSKVTACADGSQQESCYVAGVSPALELPSNVTEFLVLGRLNSKLFEGFGDLGELVVTDVFQAKGVATKVSRFWGISNNGVLCITTPCFSFDAQRLNRSKEVLISEIDFSMSELSRKEIDAAWQQISEGETLYVVGHRKKYQENGVKGKRLVVKRLFVPIAFPTEPCPEGYTSNGADCATPFGCIFPQIELTAIGGAAFIDPVTGEITSSRSKSCIDTCDFPAFLESPGQCVVALP